MPDDYGYHSQGLPCGNPDPAEPVYAPCCDECDGVTGEDVDPEYYCQAGTPWSEHDEA
jgi:hypothetical protein